MTDHQWFKAGCLDETKPFREWTRNTHPSDSAASWVTETAEGAMASQRNTWYFYIFAPGVWDDRSDRSASGE